MHQLLNTLYVTTPEAYVRLDHETLRVEVEKERNSQVPLHHLGAVVCFGDVLISPALLHRCADDGRSVVLLDRNGRFKGRLEGPVSGNVLLRKAQHEAVNDPELTLAIARNMVAGKIQNVRQIVLRAAREAEDTDDATHLKETGQTLAIALERTATAEDLDQLRGFEGEAARQYFGSFTRMVREDREAFQLNGRTGCPPRDRINALLSFLYALLLGDCVSAAEGVGLDPQMGFLHALRPGRPALGLDLMEELRSVIAERLALTLINRRQINAAHFVDCPGGAVDLSDEGRKEVIVAYQKRKQEEIQHPVLEQKMPIGLIPHVQARLLARVLRGDMEHLRPTYIDKEDIAIQVLVAYDVATEKDDGKRRLRKVAQVCKNFGQRVQKSVFECLVDQAQYEQLIRDLVKCIDEKEDNLRVYRLREPKEQFCRHFGVNPSVNFDDPLLV